jgi:hypothetical protein
LINLSRHIIIWFFTILFTLFFKNSSAQTDTTRIYVPEDSINAVATPIVTQRSVVDSVFLNHSPKIAATRSAIIPGWGQAYNRRYWKIPIVYGALGVTGTVFVYNVKTYRELRFAYRARVEASTPRQDPQGLPLAPDSTNYNQLKEIYRVLDVNGIRTYRDEFRRNIDFSALFFILFWGLNVVDATVDAHLRTFDVSPDLSFHIRAGYSDMSRTAGLRFILAFK